MQFIPGDDLSEMMTRKRGPFPPNQVLTWADQLLDALDYLHTQDPQIVHRDIKPQNLKLTSRGQIILLDFGLAKGQAGEISRVTTTASIFGYTPNYAPLEQIQGLGTDTRSDLYAFGATLYHLMTGVKPPDALTRAAAIVNGQSDPLLKPSQANSAVGPEVDDVLVKAMAQNREQRYASAAEMRKALHGAEQASTIVDRGEAKTVLFPPPPTTVTTPTQTVAGQPTVATTGETTVVRRRDGGPRRLLPIALGAAGLVLLVCVAAGYFALHKSNGPTEPVTSVTVTPIGGPAQSTPSPTPATSASLPEQKNVVAETPAAAPKKSPRNEEAKKASTPQPRESPRGEGEGHEGDIRVVPEVPDLPDSEGPNRRRPHVRTLPGGVVIRDLPDGSQIITMRDGTRVMVTKDGKREVLNPPRPKRPRPGPTQYPSP